MDELPLSQNKKVDIRALERLFSPADGLRGLRQIQSSDEQDNQGKETIRG